jgi:DNA-directed RNA polymerase subunit RPC12/RpoP
MPIPFKCPSCKVEYQVADDLAGKPIICRECNHRGQVSGSAPPAAPRTTVTFVCPTCGKPSQVPASKLGSQVRCLGCGKLGQVTAGASAGVAGAGSGDLLTRRTFVMAAVVGFLLMGSAATGAFLARWHPKHPRPPRPDGEGSTDAASTDRQGRRGRRGPPGEGQPAGGPPPNPQPNPAPAPQN